MNAELKEALIVRIRLDYVHVIEKMETNGVKCTVTLFGKPLNLEEECQKIADQLSEVCGDNRFVECSKEIARLKIKINHLQDAFDGCKEHNTNLTSLNDNLSDTVKDLISMQDSQLEQYSTTLVFLMQERKDLLKAAKSWQKEANYWKREARKRKRDDALRDSSDDTESNACTAATTESTLISNVEEANVQVESGGPKSTIENTPDVPFTPNQKPERSEGRKILGTGGRHLDSMESSMDSCRTSELAKSTPASCKGSFVNSIVQKLESKGKIHKLKSFDEPRQPDVEIPSSADHSLDCPQSVEAELRSAELSEIERLKTANDQLQEELGHMRQTCESLSKLLENTYEEMHESSLQTRDEMKDQLIACLRARLLEAISDLMKSDKNRSALKSVACGNSLPRHLQGAPASNKENTIEQDPACSTPAQTMSEPALSPSSRASRILFGSPATKLKAFRAEHRHKLKMLSCWNKQLDDST